MIFFIYNCILLFEKANPTIISYFTPTDIPFFKMNETNIMIGFYLYDKNSDLVDLSNDDYFTISNSHAFHNAKNEPETHPINLIQCNYSLNYDLFSKLNIFDNILCLDFNNKMLGGNFYGLQNYYYLYTQIYFNFTKFLINNNNDFDKLNNLFPPLFKIYYSIRTIDLMNFEEPVDSYLGFNDLYL